jgi:hypothetical protein
VEDHEDDIVDDNGGNAHAAKQQQQKQKQQQKQPSPSQQGWITPKSNAAKRVQAFQKQSNPGLFPRMSLGDDDDDDGALPDGAEVFLLL